MEEHDVKAKVRKLFKKIANSSEGNVSKETEIIPKSITFTKTALPILYSNLILIEDMKYENSNYFLGSNGFISKKITLSSLKYDQGFNLSNCVFRIFPRTYNVNKYKVLDYINKKCTLDVQDINFKFSAEIFNNLDIIQNKFGEPVRYGDIVMLMHENTQMFIQYVNSTKSLTFSNHDGDATLFSFEPASEIMLNDDKILKSGQPIRLKVAGFKFASQNLFFGLSTPYSSLNKQKEVAEIEENMEEEENEDDEQGYFTSEEALSKDKSTKDKLTYDKKEKKYEEKPDLVVEENSPMNWRFVLYNSFTTNEDLINFGDYIQIVYCDQNMVLGAITEEKEELNLEIKRLPSKSKRSFDLKENILVPDDDEVLIDDINESDLKFKTINKNTEFYLSSQTPYNKSSTEDVNSTWILENVYPKMKMQSFIRFYEDEKLDTYRMTFRLRHFKTNKILSEPAEKQGIMKGEGINKDKMYKFILIDNIIENENSYTEEQLLSEEYQYSLFGFKKTNKSKSVDSTTPYINDFLKLYHVNTQCYIKIQTGENKKKTTLNFDDLLKCYLTLIKYPDEKEVVRIERVHYNTQWKFQFVKNLSNLTNYIIKNIKQELGEAKNINLYSINNNTQFPDLANISNDDFFGEENLDLNIFTKLKFILDKLFKFVMNKFINKYNDYCGFSNVVNNRQLLLSHFDFSNLFLVKLIYFYWMHDNNLKRIRKIEDILSKLIKSNEANNYLNNISQRDKVLYQMFRYTESIFQFMIIYCKDNYYIKKELYKYIHVFFIFMNLSSSCIDAMIEIFKNESSNLNFIIRDCLEKKPLQNTLLLLYNEYFKKFREKQLLKKNRITEPKDIHEIKNLTLFDLILEYIKISVYSSVPSYDLTQIKNNQQNCKVISFNPREKYIDLLISLVHMDDKPNIQDNQVLLIKKIIEVFAGKYILNPPLSGSDECYPPCLVNLIYELAKDNKISDVNNANYEQIKMIYNFITQNENFTENRLERNNDDLYFDCYSKIYTYLKQNQLNALENKDRVCNFFSIQKEKFMSLMKNTKRNTWNINFLDNKQVNLSCSIIKFMKDMTALDLLTPQDEKDFLNFLISFLRLKNIIYITSKVSNIIQGDMIIKEKSILERIIKTEHEKYISVSETWHKIYQIFRRVLMNELDSKFYKKEQKGTKSDFQHLQSRKKGDPPVYKGELVEKEVNNLISSQNKLIENEDINLIENEPTEEDNKDKDSDNKSQQSLKYDENLFNKLDGEYRNYEIITSEDAKKENRIKLIRNIVSVFKLLITKNINFLKKNFVEYYSDKAKDNDDNNKFVFKEFIQRCIPSLDDGNENINRLIRRYCEQKIFNTFPSNEYINLNNFLDSSKSEDLNFIQNLIIAFSTSEEEENQEIIISLLYKYFHQRTTLFRDIILFNEQLLPEKREKVQQKFNNNNQDIKVIFSQFFQNYELNKNKYDEDKPDKIESFFNLFIKETSNLYENIFNYWKAEISLKENTDYDIKKIDLMVNKIKSIEQTVDETYTTKIYLDNLSQISYFLYYIRNNMENQYITSLVSILNENGDEYYKMFYSLITDIISKGKKLVPFINPKIYIFWDNKNKLSDSLKAQGKKKIFSIKNKFYTSFNLLILLFNIVLPKDDKLLTLLTDIIEDKKDLLKLDSYIRFLILLIISDIQKLYFSIDYFYIFKKCNEFVEPENFGTIEAKSDNKIVYPICFSTLYLDIIYNVLSCIIYKNKMINETYLDEIIADTFLSLLKRIKVFEEYDFSNKNNNNNNPETKEKIKLIYKLIKTVNLMSNIEQLNRVIMLKIDPMNSSNFNNELIILNHTIYMTY